MRRDAEWLQPDGLGGFASGTASGIRTRRYHALLLAARTPPTRRVVLVNGVETWVEYERRTAEGATVVREALSAHRYRPDVIHPDGERRLESFADGPWPRWIWRLGNGARIEQAVVAVRGQPAVICRWRVIGGTAAGMRLMVRPLISGRDIHSLHRMNDDFRFDARTDGARVSWRPYADLPAITAWSTGSYAHAPEWYRDFVYVEERARGLDDLEDLGSPGELAFDLGERDALLVLSADIADDAASIDAFAAAAFDDALQRSRRARSRLEAAADRYIVRRAPAERADAANARAGRTIIAGYPWFSDWGRDTFIAIRGLCLATGRWAEALDILLSWTGLVSEGMLPNLLPEAGSAPEYNAVDASLWYVVAVHELLARAPRGVVSASSSRQLHAAIDAILDGYARGTRHGIRADVDGLLAAGEAGVQLTWMDAKIGDWVVTPRIGKPVEVQALWLNALRAGATLGGDSRWQELLDLGLRSFERRFWNAERQCLFDVVDVDHRREVNDPTIRPNQILAVGGLPLPLLAGDRARAVVDLVEARLWTPLGLRTLAPGEPGYTAVYAGDMRQRDASYHQGPAWPWLLGPFVDAWVRVRGATPAAKAAARQRFLEPLLRHLDEAGLGHISELTDAEPPFAPRGAPFQAWSLGEAIRIEREILADGVAFAEANGELEHASAPAVGEQWPEPRPAGTP